MKILYSDKQLAVCVKPVGLDSESEVPTALKNALGGEIFPVHRLDKNVGGIMVYARTKQAAATLSRAVQEGSMVKEYVAMVHGTPPETGDWEDYLFKDSRKNKVFAVKKERKRATATAPYRPNGRTASRRSRRRQDTFSATRRISWQCSCSRTSRRAERIYFSTASRASL